MIGLARSSVALASTPLTPYISGAITHRFRSDYGVTITGGAVSQWGDMVGSNNATQAIGSNRPTRSPNALGTKPAIVFDGTSSFLDVGGDGTAGARTYIVVARTSRTSANRLFDHGLVGLASLNEDPRSLILMGASNYRYFTDFSQADDGAPHVFTIEIPGASQASISSARLLSDAAAQIGGTPVTAGSTASWSGLRIGGGTNRFSGQMFEFLVYNRLLTAAELAKVHFYLINYYGI